MKNVMMGTKMTTRVVIRIAQELSKDGIVQEVTQLILIHVQKFVETDLYSEQKPATQET
mgnify:CR=1 FL=1